MKKRFAIPEVTTFYTYPEQNRFTTAIKPKMKASAKYLLLTVTIFLVGCASAPQQYWSHQTKTQQQFYQDNSQCSSMANNGGNLHQNVPHTGQPFDTSGLQNTLGQVGDQNRRTNIQNQCMYGKGWSLKTREKSARGKLQKWSHWSKPESQSAQDSALCTTSGDHDSCMKTKGWYPINY